MFFPFIPHGATAGQMFACLFVHWLALGKRDGAQGCEDVQMRSDSKEAPSLGW